MTPQRPDKVIFMGKTYFTYSNPFFYYRHSIKPKERPLFYGETTANHNGYIAYYEVRDDKLYMTKLEGNLLINEGKKTYYKEVGLDAIFPGRKEVFADWFTGDLNLTPPDKINWSYESKEPEPNSLYLYFEKGLLIYSGELHNVVTERISKLHWELYDLKHRKKRTMWFYVGHRFFPKLFRDEMDYW